VSFWEEPTLADRLFKAEVRMTDSELDALQEKLIKKGWPVPTNQTPLDPEFKEKWVKALRTGEYKQGQGLLFDGEGHCCLGVACEVEAIPSSRDHFNGGRYDFASSIRTVAPPPGWKGLTEDTVMILTQANDGDGCWDERYDRPDGERGARTFDEIADWIEAFL
jgi:hypothetical protein